MNSRVNLFSILVLTFKFDIRILNVPGTQRNPRMKLKVLVEGAAYILSFVDPNFCALAHAYAAYDMVKPSI